MPAKISAGLLMFRKGVTGLEVLLAHPVGPFFKNKDAGAWTIPKGEAAADEDLVERARIEFEEEIGMKPAGEVISLGTVRQKGGKTVHGWAMEGALPDGFVPRSNTFEIEWPLRSGKMQTFPEVDRAQFFSLEEAAMKINQAQTEFLARLDQLLRERKDNKQP